jgi:cob(I)alamin adenosyltransferase
MILVNTGNGKGKTTAALGLALRALGHNQKVLIIQLFKGENFYGEQNTFKNFPSLDFFSFAPKHPFCFPDVQKETVIEQCNKALEKVKEIAENNPYNLIILEEFNIALRDEYMGKEVLLPLIKKLSDKCTVVITGRGAPAELIEIADTVTEMKEIKHAYTKGIKAQAGIEF